MAQITTTNNDLTIPSFHFHQTTFGQNIRLEMNGIKAVRHTSFDHGILINNIFQLDILFLFKVLHSQINQLILMNVYI